MYSKLFWDHVRHSRNNRALSDALVGEGRYSRCGDRLKIYLKVDDGRIAQATFQARACAPVVAVASLGTELLQNQELETAQKLDIFELDKQLGRASPTDVEDGVPIQRVDTGKNLGHLSVLMTETPENLVMLPTHLNDNKILNDTGFLKQRFPDRRVVLVTNRNSLPFVRK